MYRPEPPKTHDPYKRESYEELNRYFNEAEKYIDFKEAELEACTEKKWGRRRKLEKMMKIFYNQPSMVIQWMPDKQHYSWGFIGPSRAQNMLEELLRILTSNEEKDT